MSESFNFTSYIVYMSFIEAGIKINQERGTAHLKKYSSGTT